MDQSKSNTGMLLLAVIITALVVGGGVYFWQNSKASLQTPTEDTSVKSNKSKNETTDWKTYTGMGLSIKYPNDGTYSVDENAIDRNLESFIISQKSPGNRIYVYKTATDQTVAQDNFSTKVINDKRFKQFIAGGIGDGYGYIIKTAEGEFYNFESTGDPENEVFELMMTTLTFE